MNTFGQVGPVPNQAMIAHSNSAMETNTVGSLPVSLTSTECFSFRHIGRFVLSNENLFPARLW